MSNHINNPNILLDEINFLEVYRNILKYKTFIFIVTIVFTFSAYLYSNQKLTRYNSTLIMHMGNALNDNSSQVNQENFVESATDYWNYIVEPTPTSKNPDPAGYSRQNNSVQSIVDVLDNYLLLPESEIMRRAFGYDRSTSYGSNKKYADMLRRGLTKGSYKRVNLGKGASSKYPQSEYFYFTNHFKQC